MDNLFFARSQMALSLGFHIVFASIGITMPLLMTLSETQWLRSQNPVLLQLTKAWAKGTAVFFAIGAVSGTVLSFELGLLFPKFMEHAGAVIGMPFSLEGFAFFTEAIFLGIYLYGWEKVSKRAHILAGVVVAVSGAASALFVTLANAWMNSPTGFDVEEGHLTNIDPLKAMLSPFLWHEVPHTLLASLLATSLAVAAIHAFVLLRNPKSAFHLAALKLALVVAIPCALLQPVVGHFAGQQVAKLQPAKFAAMEALEKTQTNAPIEIGPLKIPGALSFLATNDFHAKVPGLDAFAEKDQPPVAIVHWSFRAMVMLGTYLSVIALWGIWSWRRGFSRRYLLAIVVAGPMGYLATEAGWIVTEVGRQPWVIYGFLRTSEAVTPMPGLVVPFIVFSLIYAVLGVASLLVLIRYVKTSVEKTA